MKLKDRVERVKVLDEVERQLAMVEGASHVEPAGFVQWGELVSATVDAPETLFGMGEE